MDRALLSRITKDFLNLDPQLVPSQARYRVGWGGSILMPHQQASLPRKKAKRISIEAMRLVALRKRLNALFEDAPSMISLETAPQLAPPKEPPASNFSLPRYFARGTLDRRPLSPIAYLLMETREMDRARLMPGSGQLLRSLCKGKGVLRRNAEGLVYLDVDNRFISMLQPYLKLQGLDRPPYFMFSASPSGAHIPVIPEREAAFHYLEEVRELGQFFSFEVEGLYSMTPSAWPEVEEVWFFKLRSQELEDFRQRYFLPAHPGGHPFLIALAIKPRVGSRDLPLEPAWMRVNPACLQA